DLEPLAVVETAAVDEPRPDLLETGRERPRTRHGPGLDEGLPLPDLRARAVIRLEGLDGAHQRPLVPRGPEPRVDPVGEAFARRGLERADRALRDAREELVRRRRRCAGTPRGGSGAACRAPPRGPVRPPGARRAPRPCCPAHARSGRGRPAPGCRATRDDAGRTGRGTRSWRTAARGAA